MKRINIFILMALLAASLSGCLGDGSKFEDAKRERDEYRLKLQEIRLANDLLNKNVAVILAECHVVSEQLALKAAMDIQRDLVLENKLNTKPNRRPKGTNQNG